MLTRVTVVIVTCLVVGLGAVLADDLRRGDLGGAAAGQAFNVGNLAAPEPPDPLFIRGDADKNGEVEITDAIDELAFLFLGSVQPSCPDAADVNDDGFIDLSDPLYILTFLFIGGVEMISNPYPEAGTDPTLDTLGDCL